MGVTIDEMECRDCIFNYPDGHCHFDGKDVPPCMLPETTKEQLIDEEGR